ncbi:5510_t:CDS:2 [Paraglomus occultum]|uniref:Signal recognition particle receptor subunit beta n=1 Tax=Paraglomus occultum TaxID=144539 RepID=A0A9N9FBA7_9GLOM|nr:5510_t:CDS:2 [Paraglomus occultum]
MNHLMYDNILFTVALFAVVAVILAIAIQQLYKKKSAYNTYLFLGLSGSGKTALYAKLRYDQAVETHTSMKENEAYVRLFITLIDETEPLLKTPVHIVDIPGHEKLRFKFTEFIPIARGVVFLIDSATIGRSVRPVAEYLYDILANKHVIKRKIPVLIACNKKDLLTSLPHEKIQVLLEDEIDQLRITRTASLDHRDSGDEIEFLGYENEKFKFEHLVNKVEIVGCSVDKDEFNNIKEWITDVESGY